jgi:hypothetical protein
MTSFINKNKEEIIKNDEIVAYYPIAELKALKSRFKEICTHPDFESYEDLDDFINRIYFLEFLYFYTINLYDPMNIAILDLNNRKQFLIIQQIAHNFVNDISRIYHNSSKNERISIAKIAFLKIYDIIRYLNRTKDIDTEKMTLILICKGFNYFLDKYESNKFVELYESDWSIQKFIDLMNYPDIHNIEEYKVLFGELQLEKKYKLKLYLMFQKKFKAEIAKLRIKPELKLTKYHSDFGSNDMFIKYVFPEKEGNSIYDFLKSFVVESNVKNIKKNVSNITYDIQIQRNALKFIQQEIKNNPLAISSNIKNKVSEIKNTLASYNSSNSKEARNEARKEITKIFQKLAKISKKIHKSIKMYKIYENNFPKIGNKPTKLKNHELIVKKQKYIYKSISRII